MSVEYLLEQNQVAECLADVVFGLTVRSSAAYCMMVAK